MSFTELEQAPDATEFIPTISARTIESIGAYALYGISLAMVQEEVGYWCQAAEKQPESTLGFIGRDLSAKLKKSSPLFIQVMSLLITNKLQKFDAMHNVALMQSSLGGLIGYSQLLRSEEVMNALTTAHEEKSQGQVLLDFSEKQIDISGIHGDDIVLRDAGLPLLANGQERWFEAENIYVRARRPAEFSNDLIKKWRLEKGSNLDRTQFTSFSGKVKVSYWQQ